MKEYLFDRQRNLRIREKDPIAYEPCGDGVRILHGSLLGSGFTPDYRNGITLPEEIDGIKVTELGGRYEQEELGYIESQSLKRIRVEVMVRPEFGGEKTCSFPILCGGVKKTLETAEFRFLADGAHITPVTDSRMRAALTHVEFSGTIIDDPDFEYGHFQSGLFSGCRNLRSVRGVFQGNCLTGSTFEGCESLAEVPDLRVKYMGDREFRGCASLQKIRLFDGLKRIGAECFKDCKSLREVFIPDTVESIGKDAFAGCRYFRLVIHGKAGSAAEEYAKSSRIRFRAE